MFKMFKRFGGLDIEKLGFKICLEIVNWSLEIRLGIEVNWRVLE